LKDLKKDKDQLRILFNAAKNVTPDTDAKLQELKKLIAAKVANPATNKLGQPVKKVLVFTAFADTAAYLFDSLRVWAENDLGIHIALVTGGGGNHTTFGKMDYNQILTNFSPRSKNRAKIPTMQQDGEIDLLIATDCISEGQNLQDCDYLVNYDIHWNPVRIIQRFGRIDRTARRRTPNSAGGLELPRTYSANGKRSVLDYGDSRIPPPLALEHIPVNLRRLNAAGIVRLGAVHQIAGVHAELFTGASVTGKRAGAGAQTTACAGGCGHDPRGENA
jgi:hypothetical protein